MPPKKNSQEDCHKRVKITVELKREIIKSREEGMSVAALARRYKRTSSTICTILKNKDKIKEANASKGVTRISAHRSQVLDDVERLLLLWINEKQLLGHTINENIICEKAKLIFTDLVDKTPNASAPEKVFKASRGWFEKFKRRTGFHILGRQGEGAGHGAMAANNFLADFLKCLLVYLPQQVFICHQTGLLWKKMPVPTCIAAEAGGLSDHKPMEDRMTVLLCANACGELKIKPLIVSQPEAPGAFKKRNMHKSGVKVMWRWNSRACVTRDLFTEWLNQALGPSVERYLLEKNLPLQALLIMDSPPAHLPGLQNDLLHELKFIKIQFLPSHTSALLQPMDQRVIISFKKLYTKALLKHCFEMIKMTNLTLGEFCKDHLHIVTGLKLIEKAWERVTKRTITSSWKKDSSESPVESDVEEFESESDVEQILCLARALGLKVDNSDIDELLKEQKRELTTEELIGLYRISQEEAAAKRSDKEEEEGSNQLSASSIREMLSAWDTVASFVEEYHPDKTVALHAVNLFSDSALSPFHEILKTREKTNN